MNILVRSWSLHTHRERSLVAAALTLALLLSACAAPTRLPIQPTSQPTACEPANLPTCRLAYLQQAAYNYNRYHALAPDDLLGLKRLTEVCTALEDPSTGLRARAGVEDPNCREAAERVAQEQGGTGVEEQGEIRNSQFSIRILHKALEARTDDRRIVAELLGVPVESVELGPNLLENGGFEEWEGGRPQSWMWSDMATGDPWNKGLFIGGSDSLGIYSGYAARVDGLWLQYREDRDPGRCGYWLWDERWNDLRPITLTAGMPYMLSFYYRTNRLPDGMATVWVSYEPTALFAGDRGLSVTDGEWRHFVVVGWNQTGKESEVRPLLRSWGTGDIWWDGVETRPVFLKVRPDLINLETQFVIR